MGSVVGIGSRNLINPRYEGIQWSRSHKTKEKVQRKQQDGCLISWLLNIGSVSSFLIQLVYFISGLCSRLTYAKIYRILGLSLIKYHTNHTISYFRLTFIINIHFLYKRITWMLRRQSMLVRDRMSI